MTTICIGFNVRHCERCVICVWNLTKQNACVASLNSCPVMPMSTAERQKMIYAG